MVSAEEEWIDMSRAFESQLNAFRRRWQLGLFLQVIVQGAGLALVAYAGYSLLDFLVGFEADTRYIANTFACVILGGFTLFWLVQVLRYSGQEAAIEADKASGNKRRTALSAFELQQAKQKGEALSDFLLEQSVQKAAAVLESIPPSQGFPNKLLLSQAKRLGIQALVLLVSVLVQRPGANVVLERILHPSRDIPPFTGLVFAITPETPQITYGGDATINVAISGKPVKSQVYLLTRSGSSEYRSACFQEGPGRYAQKLEKVIQPVEFAFATGRARSQWHKVDLLLQPRIARADVTIIPPAYTGRPKQSNLAGKAPLAAIAGSQAIVTMTSNRPLKEGSLQIHPANEAGIESVVAAEPVGPHTLSFHWVMRENADLNFTICDVRGTPNGDPFHLAQQVTPDQPPQAVITEPGAYALATPESVVNLCGYAEDDLGLSRVDLVRTMVGFRDRSKHLGPDTTQTRLEFSSQLELSKLGVAPGQTLEFYAEASDTNPSLMGIGTSPVCRIEIISTENYAQMVRDRTTLEEFIQRYEVLSDQLESLAQSLKKLEEAADSGSDSQKEAALKESQEMAKKAAELFAKMAADFPAFDSDKALSKAAKEIGSRVQGVQKKLGDLKPSAPDLSKAAKELSQELGLAEQEMQEQKKTGEEIAAVSRVMETVADFQKVVLEQTELERQLNRLARSGDPEDLRKMPTLSERQKEIAQELKTAIHELSKRRADLPKGYENLDMTAAEFLAGLEPMNVPQDMESGATALENQNGREGARLASVALEKLRKMLSNCKGMGGMCQGELGFKVPDPLNQTMRQMLQSLLCRATGSGSSGGSGTGTGTSGSAESGESMGGNSSLNTMVFGPARGGFNNNKSGPFGNGAGPARGGNQGVNRVQGSAQISTSEPVALKSKGWPMENVPEKYRNAVKQYFSQPEEKP
jgi:hypothetical protein